MHVQPSTLLAYFFVYLVFLTLQLVIQECTGRAVPSDARVRTAPATLLTERVHAMQAGWVKIATRVSYHAEVTCKGVFRLCFGQSCSDTLSEVQ